MIATSNSHNDYFRAINVGRSRTSILIVLTIGILNTFVVDPLIFDLSNQLNRILQYSHIAFIIISAIALFAIHYSKSDRESNLYLFLYLFLLTAIESGVSGALDTPTERGPSVYLATVLIISFVFYYNTKFTLLWLVPNYLFYISLAWFFHETPNQLVSSIGNGTLYTIIILGIKLFIYRQKVKEYENQKYLIDYIKNNKPKKLQNNFKISGELSAKFYTYVIEEKNYLNKELSIALVAKEIGTNTNYLSQCINTEYNKNFNALINEFRVEESIQLMNHKLFKVLTIEAISGQVGFNSKSAFYKAFKDKTGMTPLEFMKNKN